VGLSAKRWRCAAHAAAAGTFFALAWTGLVEAAEVYRWIDERGVVNYSNEPPPKNATAKDLRVVEDRLSVYTPEKRPERAPAAPGKAAPGAATATRDALPERRAPSFPPPPPPGYDPCVNVGPDGKCYEVVPYPAPPVFSGRRPPLLVQPELPPGTIAGQSTSAGGTIPGQSGTTPVTPRSSRRDEPSASFTLKRQDPERERDRDGRR
jgi:hypothetical protein